MSEYIKVELSKLRAFSGVLYDENEKEIMFNGNPFYVPDDYLTGND